LSEEEILFGSEIGIDESARESLNYLTGRDLFDQEQLIITSNQDDDKDVIAVNEELLICTLKPTEDSSIINELNATIIIESDSHSIWHDTPRKFSPGEFDPVMNLIKDHLVK